MEEAPFPSYFGVGSHASSGAKLGLPTCVPAASTAEGKLPRLFPLCALLALVDIPLEYLRLLMLRPPLTKKGQPYVIRLGVPRLS